MKYFWFIFSIFIFTLAASPCCDDESVSESRAEIAFHAADDHNGDSHAHDICSPFCTCASCGCHGCNFDGFQAIEISSSGLPAVTDKVAICTFECASNFEAAIWQPPQLG